MNRMEQLYAKPKKRMIGGMEFELHPLTMDDMGALDIDEKAPVEEQTKKMKELISKVFRCSMEEASQISMEYMMEMMKNIMELHNIQGDKATNLLKKRIEEARTKKDVKPTGQA